MGIPFLSTHLRSLAQARRVRLTTLALSALGLLASCDKNSEPIEATFPAKITVPQRALSPEGIQYDEANQRYIVSSRTQGRIGTVRDDSTYTQLADDPKLVSTIGLNLDATRQRLLAAVSDAGANTTRSTATTLRKLAALAIFNPSSGALLSYIDLGAMRPNLPHFANDIAVDNQGNAYITDSLSPIIYKVDAQGVATVFLENPQLSGGTGFGLNGLVYHPDGYLLVAKSNDGTLYKVPLANPASFTTVASTQSLVGADGLLLLDNTTLLVVTGSQSTVFQMASSDAWATTRPTGSFATGAVSPTTITRRTAGVPYVLYPYTATAPRFAITRVSF
jgi:sugar lactone lactonase YvrE